MLAKFSELTTKEMDRREFLQNAGIGMLLLIGGGLIARTFGFSSADLYKPSLPNSYGRSSYGGK